MSIHGKSGNDTLDRENGILNITLSENFKHATKTERG